MADDSSLVVSVVDSPPHAANDNPRIMLVMYFIAALPNLLAAYCTHKLALETNSEFYSSGHLFSLLNRCRFQHEANVRFGS